MSKQQHDSDVESNRANSLRHRLTEGLRNSRLARLFDGIVGRGRPSVSHWAEHSRLLGLRRRVGRWIRRSRLARLFEVGARWTRTSRLYSLFVGEVPDTSVRIDADGSVVFRPIRLIAVAVAPSVSAAWEASATRRLSVAIEERDSLTARVAAAAIGILSPPSESTDSPEVRKSGGSESVRRREPEERDGSSGTDGVDPVES